MSELSAESYSIREHTGLEFVRILSSRETQQDLFEEYRPVVTGTDIDGHPAREMLQAVEVMPGERGADQKNAHADTFDDSVTLIGSDGDDVFVWQLGDVRAEGKPAVNVVKDFGVGGIDILDISDLLPDFSREGASLDGYLSVDNEGGKTVINISTKGGGAAFVDQKIVLENIDYDPERAKQIADDLKGDGIIKSSPDTL